ncbi:MAG TPA: hypothetical protein VFW00_14270 [Rhodocyclaceae bacterium]|nr:hypothetical protein [Rhodocyclaceae bacterium]
MNRNVVATLVAILAITLVLAGFYFAFFAVAARIPPGRELGMAGASLGLFSGVMCVAICFIAYRWTRRAQDKM